MRSFHGAGEQTVCLSRRSWLHDKMEKPPFAQSKGNGAAKSIGLLFVTGTGDLHAWKFFHNLHNFLKDKLQLYFSYTIRLGLCDFLLYSDLHERADGLKSLLVWQCVPSKPGRHLQMYSLKTSPRRVGVTTSHSPSFLQGFGLQGPGKREERKKV